MSRQTTESANRKRLLSRNGMVNIFWSMFTLNQAIYQLVNYLNDLN